MKNTGIMMILFSVLAMLPGLFLVFDATPAYQPKAGALRSAELNLRLCELNRHLEPGASCAAEEAAIQTILTARPITNTTKLLWGYALLSAAPFFILMGTVLFAAGKVEDAVKALAPAAP